MLRYYWWLILDSRNMCDMIWMPCLLLCTFQYLFNFRRQKLPKNQETQDIVEPTMDKEWYFQEKKKKELN